MTVEFYKYHGTGNDFVLIDNRSLFFDKNNTELISKICSRHFGVGADGLILLENDNLYDFKMIYFNSDGKQTSMCGNGGRCIISFAKKLNIIDDKANFMAIDGIHEGIINNNLIKIKMNTVSEIQNINTGFLLDTGSPHFVKFCDSIDNINVFEFGRELRNNKEISEDGVNINFTEVIDNSSIKVRTYERGVENETLSCGTGVIASALSAYKKGLVDTNRIKINTLGGELFVSFEFNNIYKNIWLEGPAIEVYKGQI
ncbi:diaminopimelate epimerase [Flavobacteriaceae bacterium]|jgi:diaminopimelate epimerase|nr:diaminopimelate epimerase [Flavobacteriaceae bacterium]MDB4134921.1 diaminopimelate epimerase [Flavobacteriaceae bacterium]MDB4213005.1 diaminopimelate epimerase [Flavobacteriaceae bacterium]|tara:strand:+ start:989 stop:1759 length:771 start_codon:yes stop_codon:yes gene_type:complete